MCGAPCALRDAKSPTGADRTIDGPTNDAHAYAWTREAYEFDYAARVAATRAEGGTCLAGSMTTRRPIYSQYMCCNTPIPRAV
jgi:hypothetical protein